MDQQVGPDGIGVQIDGNSNTVTLVAGTAQLMLERRHSPLPPPTDDRQILLTERRATTLVGRDAELADLDAWLESDRPVSARCLTGRGGVGKTRLAIELCERAEAGEWIAGFLTHEELQRFHSQQNVAHWRWNRDVLAVVDYAAASGKILRIWLEQLARKRAGGAKLRLLLLERHGDTDAGWWAELARPAGSSGAGPDELLDPARPIPLASLSRVEDRRALLMQTMQEAARVRGQTHAPELPPLGTRPEFDRRLADDRIDNEPLYLIMAGIVAVASDTAPTLDTTRIELAERIADFERSRLCRIAREHAIKEERLVHLAACVTLQGGCDREACRRLVDDERAAMGYGSDLSTDEIVDALSDALPAPGRTDVDAVRPDLIGEAFVVQHVVGRRRNEAEQTAIVARAYARASGPVLQALVRVAQDLSRGGVEHASVVWLGYLANRCSNLGELSAIADALPTQTVSLRKQAAEISERIVGLRRQSAASGPTGAGEVAASLFKLSNRLSGLGRHEPALAAIEEAVATYRELAQTRPNAFAPDLAHSLNNLSNHLSALGRREPALAAIEDAVAIYRELAKTRPEAFAPDLARSLNNL